MKDIFAIIIDKDPTANEVTKQFLDNNSKIKKSIYPSELGKCSLLFTCLALALCDSTYRTLSSTRSAVDACICVDNEL